MLATLIAVTWRRVLRGRALWVCVVIALMPLVIALAVQDHGDVFAVASGVEVLVMALLPPVFVAASIGEEIEDRTTTYLWSRPLPRWTMIVGKLLALAPIAMVLIVAGWLLAIQIPTGELPPLRSTIAYASGGLTIATVAAGIATLAPRHGMALSIVYIVIVDTALAIIPASLQSISIIRQVALLSGQQQPSSIASPAITLAIIAVAWLALGIWRVGRLES